MATIRQLLTLAFIVLIAYAAHIYDNSPMSPRPVSFQFAESVPYSERARTKSSQGAGMETAREAGTRDGR